LAPDFGEPNPEEAIMRAELRPRMAALIDGQLLSESKILQGQVSAEFEDGNECLNERK
jgi:hypothetical protein